MRIQENSFDRKVNNAIKGHTGLSDFKDVRSFLLDRVYKVIPELRLMGRVEPIETALKWFFNADGSLKNEDYIAPVRQILQTVKEKNPSELDKMGYAMQFMEPQSYCSCYSHYQKRDMNTVKSSQSRKQVSTPSGYEILRVDSFDEALGLGMSEWCIGRDREWWDEMVGYTATVYLVRKKGADSVRLPSGEMKVRDEDGEEYETSYDEYFMDMSYTNALRDPNYGRFGSGKYPYDEYGLSKLVVIANENGMFEVWSRYNMTEGKDGSYLTKGQLSKLIGVDAGSAFPYVNFFANENWKRVDAGLLERKIRRMVREAISESLGRSLSRR